MLILHAAQTGIGFLAWAETSSGRRGRSPRKGGAARHPCDAGRKALAEALVRHAGLDRNRVRLTEARAWLPSTAARPLASDPLLRGGEEPEPATRIAPWEISAALLEPDAVFCLLGQRLGRRTLGPGVVVGPDLAWWSRALRLAGALVAKGQVLPGVRVVGKELQAVWKPVLLDQDAVLLAEWSAAMPAAARALADPREVASPCTSALTVLTAFLTDCVDELMRLRRTPAAPPPASVHDAWLDALAGPDRVIHWERGEIEALRQAAQAWERPVALAASAPVRLCFQLDEPETSDGPDAAGWRVRYLLHPLADRSLLVPLEKVLAGRPVKTLGPGCREFALTALGQAAALCPHVAASLHVRAPGGFSLDTAQAYAFLTRTAPLLEQAGFGVLLPAWWTKGGRTLRPALRARVESPPFSATAGLGLDQVVAFRWEVSLDGEALTARELRELAKLKAPLVRLRGQWVEVCAEELRASARLWDRRESRQASAREVLAMALGRVATPPGFGFDGVTADGWMAELLDALQGRTRYAELPPPATLAGTLRPYQVRGFSWMCFLRQWGLGACLADDMGLGKTIQTLALVLRDREEGQRLPALLVCPTSVVQTWVREAARFAPGLRVLVHHGADRNRGEEFKTRALDHDLVVSTYGLLQRDQALLAEMSWAGVILDEAQNIKNPATRQARAARALRAGYRVALTGTPVENHVGDLWSIMEFLNPGVLGSAVEFRRDFLVPIQAGSDPEAAARLRERTGPFILRRLKTDPAIAADLPDKLENTVFCRLTREQATLYAAVLEDMERELKQADGMQRRGIILATLTRLKQVCNHPAQLLADGSALAGRSGKLERLGEMVGEVLEAGEKALVFTQFTEMGTLLHAYLQEFFGREVLFLHGGVPMRERDRMVRRFESDRGGPPLFVLSLKAGGTGLTLVAANHVFHFDRWWNPAVETQATDRAFRIGQTRNVFAHALVCAGTVEERIAAMIERKREVADQVVGAGEDWLTELSDADLRRTLALDPSAVEE